MAEDFLDAHHRHWDDAELLYQTQRWANADHLFGVSAECGLKRLMEMMNNGALNPQKDRLHMPSAWSRFQTYRSGHIAGPQLALPNENPFQGWHVSQRYDSRDGFNQARVDPHRSGAELVHKLIRKAQRDGML